MGSSSATENPLLLSKIATSEGHGENSPYFQMGLAKKLTENDEQPPVRIPPHIQMDMTAAQQGSESGPAAAGEDNNGCCTACLKLVECLRACNYIVSIADTLMNWIGAA